MLFVLVETSGLEPLTPCMSSKYSNQLSYASVYEHIYYTFFYSFVKGFMIINTSSVNDYNEIVLCTMKYEQTQKNLRCAAADEIKTASCSCGKIDFIAKRFYPPQEADLVKKPD